MNSDSWTNDNKDVIPSSLISKKLYDYIIWMLHKMKNKWRNITYADKYHYPYSDNYLYPYPDSFKHPSLYECFFNLWYICFKKTS